MGCLACRGPHVLCFSLLHKSNSFDLVFDAFLGLQADQKFKPLRRKCITKCRRQMRKKKAYFKCDWPLFTVRCQYLWDPEVCVKFLAWTFSCQVRYICLWRDLAGHAQSLFFPRSIHFGSLAPHSRLLSETLELYLYPTCLLGVQLCYIRNWR